ncbi:hypothetical protein HHK36_013058 [Tetracentron sinense]|uniref:Uncharacterized protein n=1 Tax=Tetracentron sinense TaxID=13715 RepID=A0A835DG89_TETSI|nr:hypothetical protein HHK36_013058 [Tetracentron sinense]
MQVGSSSKSSGLQRPRLDGLHLPTNSLSPQPKIARNKAQVSVILSGLEKVGLNPGGAGQDIPIKSPSPHKVRDSGQEIRSGVQGGYIRARPHQKGEEERVDPVETEIVIQVQNSLEEGCEITTPSSARCFREWGRCLEGATGTISLPSSAQSSEGRFWDAWLDSLEMEQYMSLVFTELRNVHSVEERVSSGQVGSSQEPPVVEGFPGVQGSIRSSGQVDSTTKGQAGLAISFVLVDPANPSVKIFREQGLTGFQGVDPEEHGGSQAESAIEGEGASSTNLQALRMLIEPEGCHFPKPLVAQGSRILNFQNPGSEIGCPNLLSCADFLGQGENQKLLPQMNTEDVSNWVVENMATVGQSLRISLEGRDSEEANRLLAGERGHIHLKKLQKMLRMRQQYMVAQVSALYPVKGPLGPTHGEKLDSSSNSSRSGDSAGSRPLNQGSLTISGLQLTTLPLKKMSFFSDKKEVQTSATALGYVAHAVSLIASYLDIPLRYPLRLGGSRSYIIDYAPSIEPTPFDSSSNLILFTNSKPTEFPLFLEGQDTTRAAYAIFLLNKDLEQLLNFIGVNSLGPRHVLANLKELLRIVYSPEYIDK